MDNRPARWWWYLGIPVGIAVGAVLAVWLRTSRDDALTLRRGDRVDVAFTGQLDPAMPRAGPAGPSGRFLVVMFGYTSCPDICPTTLLDVHRTLEQLGVGAEQVLPVFVTVDPARDTAERLTIYVRSFDIRIRSVSQPTVVANTLRALHARAERRNVASGDGYSMDHTAVLYVLGPDRRVIAALPEGSPTLTDDLASAIQNDPAFPHDSRRW